MHLATIPLACWMAVALLAACGPALNWRETNITATSLSALFPCKPHTASRTVTLGGKEVQLHMTACDTAGATFALGHATVSDLQMVSPVLAQWRQATLAGMRAMDSTASEWSLKRPVTMPQPVMVTARGAKPDGSTLALQGAWFAQGTEVFAALVYADLLSADATEPFFSGLKFR